MQKHCTIISMLLFIPTLILGQKSQPEVVYRRSSLYTMMINEPNRQYADIIAKTFINSPIPDKFNDHLLSERSIESGIQFSNNSKEEKIHLQENNISDYLQKNQVAKAMIAKWFNRNENGTFNMDLISERGTYNASEMDVNIAKSSKRGFALLSDAGEELINNTFIIVSDFDYVNKEEVANKIKGGLSFIKDIASLVDENVENEAATSTLTVFGKGYVVKTTSYCINWFGMIQLLQYFITITGWITIR